MADRTVLVRLQAETQAFQRAMGEAAAKARATGQEIKGAFDGASGQKLTQVGGQLTRSVTLPIIAAGVAAGGMALQFDDAFRQMQGLAGVTAEEVDGLKQSVLELAGETAQSPQRLAEALYFVRSAGIDGAAAMETLEVSARGATAGLGEAGVIADVVTSALGAYGEANISAAEAGDVLVATAREGKAEASALAPQFGRLLPIASELGVRFDEVGAGLAFLSRSGGGAELAATNLGNVLQKLLTPAEEGQRALEAMGMSTADLRASIAERGLLDTLVMLRSNLEANGMELGDFSRDAQFTTGVLALTRNGGAAAAEVFDSLANSTGALGEAFDAASQGPGFAMRQSLAEVQTILIQLGDTLLPIASSMLGALSSVAQAFAALPGPVQTFLVGLAGIAAASGPVLTFVGHIKTLQEKLTGLGPMGAQAAQALGPLAVAAGVAAVAWVGYSQRQREAEARAQEFTDAILSQTGALEDNINAVFARRLADTDIVTGAVAAGAAIEDLADIAQSSGDDISSAQDAIASSFGAYAGLEANVEDLALALERAGVAGTPLGETLLDVASSGDFTYGMLQNLLSQLALLNGDFETGSAAAEQQAAAMDAVGLAADGSAPQIDELSGAIDESAASAAEAEQAVKDYLDTLRGSIDPLFGMLTALDNNRQAQVDLDEALASGTATQEELNALYQRSAESALDVEAAAVTLSTAMANGAVSADQARSMLQGWVAQGLITQGTADVLAQRIGLVAMAADQFDGSYTASLYANTDPAAAAIGQLISRFSNAVIDLRVQANIPGGYLHSAGGFAGTTSIGGPQGTDRIPAWLSPGEYVINAQAAGVLGPRMLNALNDGQMPTSSLPLGSIAGAGGGGGVTIINQYGVTIAAPPGVDPRALADVVVTALQTRMRDGGPLPLEVRTAQRVG